MRNLCRSIPYCMRPIFVYLLLICILLATACTPKKEPSALLVNADFEPLEIDLEEAFRAGKFPKDTPITVEYDHFFKGKKRFKAYPLVPLLAPLLAQIKDTSNLRLTFTCVDGYAPNMNLNKVLQHQAYLAVQDLDQAEAGKDWVDSLAGKFRPYYLVWTDVGKTDESFAWPYGLAELRIASFFYDFADAFPTHSPSAQKGFTLFQLHCMKCHSVNKVGGVMGPEFNYPKSITTYWQKEDLYQFMLNPQAYRYSAKMPGVALAKAEFEEIYTYLLAMRGVKPTE
jgi:cytochrome c2